MNPSSDRKVTIEKHITASYYILKDASLDISLSEAMSLLVSRGIIILAKVQGVSHNSRAKMCVL